jgi:hypothetical protein
MIPLALGAWPKQSHRRIPRTIGPIKQPEPVRVVAQQYPDRFTKRAGEMGHCTITDYRSWITGPFPVPNMIININTAKIVAGINTANPSSKNTLWKRDVSKSASERCEVRRIPAISSAITMAIRNLTEPIAVSGRRELDGQSYGLGTATQPICASLFLSPPPRSRS